MENMLKIEKKSNHGRDHYEQENCQNNSILDRFSDEFSPHVHSSGGRNLCLAAYNANQCGPINHKAYGIT
jgi:hypothetical protein